MDKCVITEQEFYFDPVLMPQPAVQQAAFPSNLPTDIFPYACERSSHHFINIEDSVYKVLNAAISSEFSNGVEISMASAVDRSATGFAGMTELERHKLDELITANEVMNEPMEKLLGDQKKENPSITDVINMVSQPAAVPTTSLNPLSLQL